MYIQLIYMYSVCLQTTGVEISVEIVFLIKSAIMKWQNYSNKNPVLMVTLR